MLKKFSFIILLVLGITFPYGSMGATPRHTLASAIDRALKANPTMEEKIQALESARMSVGVAQSCFWPRVSLVANKNRLKNSGGHGSVDEISNTSTSSGLRGTLSLFAGFSHLSNLQRSLKDIAAEELRQAELELVNNIQFSFSCSCRRAGICAM